MCAHLCPDTHDITQYIVYMGDSIGPQCLSVNTFLNTLSFIHHVFQDSTVGGHSVAEMERVVAAMRKVVERLQSENESLRRSAKQKGTSVTQLETENRRLKACQLSSDSIVAVSLIPSHQDLYIKICDVWN